MIVSASYKTDIPAFYGSWFRARIAAGFADVMNPWGGGPFRVDLRRNAVDGFVFWTRNAAPFREDLDRLSDEKWPFVVQFTITGYPRSLERSVIPTEVAVRQIQALSRAFGRRSVVWRYDPVLITDVTHAEFHRTRFAELARALSGYVDEVTLSFTNVYRKTGANLERLRREHGTGWRDPESAEKRLLLSQLGGIAREAGITPTLCAQPDLLSEPLEAAACIDARRLSDVAGTEIAAKTKGNRPGCFCAQSRDIGAYDSCPHGCVYCYAVGRQETAKRKHRAHDPVGAFLNTPTSK